METGATKHRAREGKTIIGLAIGVLIISMGALGLASYTFFIVLPPALTNVNSAGWDLVNYNPGTGDELRQSASNLYDAADSLRKAGESLPCAYGCSVFGIESFSMASTRIQLHNLADSVSEFGNRANNFGGDFDQTQNLIHTVGYGALGLKDGLYYGVMTMLAFGAVGIMTGVTLLVVGKTISQL